MPLSIPGKAGRPFRTATQPVQPMQPPQMPMPTAPLLNRPGAAGGGVYGQAGSRPVPMPMQPGGMMGGMRPGMSFSPFAGAKASMGNPAMMRLGMGGGKPMPGMYGRLGAMKRG